jgi:hypothetical protein
MDENLKEIIMIRYFDFYMKFSCERCPFEDFDDLWEELHETRIIPYGHSTKCICDIFFYQLGIHACPCKQYGPGKAKEKLRQLLVREGYIPDDRPKRQN